MKTYTIKKIQDVFGKEINRTTLIKAENSGNIPSPDRQQTGSITRRSWGIEDIPQIGEKYGFLKKLAKPSVISIFTTKGGVLKSTLTLNIARMAALHNIRTCVVGLDLQGDVTGALGFDNGIDEDTSLQDAESILSNIFGLSDLESGDRSLMELVQKTDIPTLDFIPETPELHLLDRTIGNKNRREYWLKENVAQPLLKIYDLVIFDCSPNWNNLVTNAITACDLLLSPLECKINNFRNFPSFRVFLETYKKETHAQYAHLFIPTRFSPTRKLSKEIRNWYLVNAPNCISSAIKESIKGEEAMAKSISLPEHAPTSLDAQEMRQVISEVWETLLDVHIKESQTSPSIKTSEQFASI